MTYPRWPLAVAGIGFIFAPLIFWTRSPMLYAGGTFLGTVLVLAAFPWAPRQDAVSEIPDGWSYNPSTWPHRLPVVALALFGFFVAAIMASFQLGHIDSIWEPFFGDGSRRVLTSEVAKAFPISDAGLGAATYLLEGVSGLIGDKRRWKTMPWMVFLFFILVVPAGVVSIVLIMLQPVVVGAWCTMCLMTAVATLVSIPPAVDEVFASVQFLKASRRQGKSAWTCLWRGDHSPGRKEEKPAAGLSGIGLPWNLALSALIGIGIILWPANESDYIAGGLITTFAVLASAEPLRLTRALNVLIAIWLLFTPTAVHLAAAAALALLSFPRGKISQRYGPWDRYIR